MTIRVALLGVGNCSSSLVQLVSQARESSSPMLGLMHVEICGYKASDVEFVAAFDIDERKVGLDLADAIAASPNCTTQYVSVPTTHTKVSLGRLSDGIGDETRELIRVHPDAVRQTPEAIIKVLKESGAEIVVNFLPVGSMTDSRLYAELACDAGCAFVNCNPVMISCDPDIAARFVQNRLPLLGDDIKSQLGSTMLHRAIADKLLERGASISRSYQLNIGGNTDFLNMTNRARAKSKRHTKMSAVQSVIGMEVPLSVGPSDYVPQLEDHKVAYIRIEGKSCLGMAYTFEARLEVEDSPNAAGVAIDAIRCARVALDHDLYGSIAEPSGYLFKHPPVSYPEKEGRSLMDQWMADLELKVETTSIRARA